MITEGFQTARGIYHTVYNVFGMGFQTPEGYIVNGNFRSLVGSKYCALSSVLWFHFYFSVVLNVAFPRAGLHEAAIHMEHADGMGKQI